MAYAQGDCVAILMRNDIAFMEASYAAQTLGAYAVPINWHFKAEEIDYILADCGAKVLIGHADLLAPIAADAAGRACRDRRRRRRPRSPRPTASRRCRRRAVAGAHDYEAWLARQPRLRAATRWLRR